MRTASLIAVGALFVLGACATAPQPSAHTTVEVNAAYRERIALPSGHILTVRVQDVSLADAPAVTVGETVVPLDGRNPPYRVMVDVPNDRIDPRHRYVARAEIRDSDGKLRFTTDTHHGVLTHDQPDAATIIMIGTP